MDAKLRENWYVAATQPAREELAASELGRQGFRPFFPRIMRTVRHARKISTRRAALFPGYIFVQLDLGRQRWRSINGTTGVRALVTDGERPLPLPGGLVEHFVQATNASGVVDLGAGLRPGDEVRLVSGPFAELSAVLDRLDAGGRARVLIKIMNGEIALTMKREDLVPLSMKEFTSR